MRRDGLRIVVVVLTFVLVLSAFFPRENPVYASDGWNGVRKQYVAQSVKETKRNATGVLATEPKRVTVSVTTPEPISESTSELTVVEVQVSMPEPTPKPTPEPPAYTVTEMDAIKYVQKGSNVRSGPSTDYDVIGGLSVNTPVHVVGKADTGWFQIEYGESLAFIAGFLLADTEVIIATPEPVAPAPAAEVVVQVEEQPKNRWDYSLDELVQISLNECINADMSDWDKAIAINNYLCNLVDYDYSYSRYTTFDTLAYGSAICQGYANAYQKLMEAAGIPTDYVRGYAFTGSEWGRHGWNRVLIDGNYYYVDVTWNDTCFNRYLLISYEEMSADHQERELNPKRAK